MLRTFRSLRYPLLGILSVVAVSCKEPTRPDTRPPRISIVTPHRDEIIEEPVKIIAEHLGLTAFVIVVSYFVGDLIGKWIG